MKAHQHNCSNGGTKGIGAQPHGDWSAFLLQRRYLFIWFVIALIPFAVVRAYFWHDQAVYEPDTPVDDSSHQTANNRSNPAPISLEQYTKPNNSVNSIGGTLNKHNSIEGTNGDHNSTFSSGADGECDLSNGKWIPDPSGPFYTNETCRAIQEHQNCMKHGRPDTDYLHWRWRPDSCELPQFNAAGFLNLVRGKILAFIGDSIGRNHMQSLVCLLSQVEDPRDIYNDGTDKFRRWYFPSYNFTLAVLWSPFFVKETTKEIEGTTRDQLKLHLDVADDRWTSELHEFDIVLISGGQWFLKSSIYLEKDEVVGCHYCPGTNYTQLGFYFAYRKALRLAFKVLTSSPEYKGLTFLRTFTPDHFENGRWDNGGSCERTLPYKNNEITMDGINIEMYKIQSEEFKKAAKEGAARGLKFKLLDTTWLSLLRPDGHPGPYRYSYPFAKDKNAKVQNDCLHWCLPGPIDTWSEFLLEFLKRESE
ncbi:protein trichome birefringence-like 25 isoform X1 [Cryptomeria japonica]|uniref:protein trichome birefringence-like 25 isoform X1 n=1 Tax=Cryptomeria japonica TaxID=3369 RepID=UPI0025AC1B0C|nr:protein trichome birefringence-like 25 isoform X1 [Cryptomeria japonica]